MNNITLGDILAEALYRSDLKVKEQIVQKMVDLAFELDMVQKRIEEYEGKH